MLKVDGLSVGPEFDCRPERISPNTMSPISDSSDTFRMKSFEIPKILIYSENQTCRTDQDGQSRLAKLETNVTDCDSAVVFLGTNSQIESANETCTVHDSKIIRPTSATPLIYHRSQSGPRRYSVAAKPFTENESYAAANTGIYAKGRPRSSSVFGPAPKILPPGYKDMDSISQPPPPQYLRARRISFGLGGVPKSGYWGGIGQNVNDNDSDSDDSLLAATSRQTSRTFYVRGPTLMGYNRRQWHFLIVFAIVDFCSAVVISIQGPMYPREAEIKQVSASEYGFLVFGLFELTIISMCPIFGKLLGKISPQSLFNGGIFTSGISVILFGFLTDVEDTATFLTLSALLRIGEALGDAACITTAYVIITAECPDTVSTTFIFLKTFFGIGSIVGPIAGTWLYTFGGFSTPFAVLGTLLLSCAVFSLFLIPKPSTTDIDKDPSSENSVPDKSSKSNNGFLSLLKSPTVMLAALTIVTSSVSMGFLNATLEPQMREFTVKATTVGIVFILSPAFYFISSPVWSWGCHVASDPKYITLIGTMLTFVAFLLIGPAPFIPIDTYFWLTCVGLIIQGVGIGATFVSGFLLALRDTITRGYPDNEATYGLVSGLYTTLFAAGNFIGPSAAGILVDYFGFRWATTFVLALQTLLIFFVICFLLYDKLSGQGRTSSEFDDDSYSALQVSESQDEWEDSKDNPPAQKSYGAVISDSV